VIEIEIIDRVGEGCSQRFEGDELLIGRASEADLILEKAGISKRHARIWRSGDRFLIADLESTNGTFLNSKRLRSVAALAPCDRVYVGEFILRIRSLG